MIQKLAQGLIMVEMYLNPLFGDDGKTRFISLPRIRNIENSASSPNCPNYDGWFEIKNFYEHIYLLMKRNLCKRVCICCKALLSTKVAMVVSFSVGKAAVYTRDSSGPRKLPCGTPALTRKYCD